MRLAGFPLPAVLWPAGLLLALLWPAVAPASVADGIRYWNAGIWRQAVEEWAGPAAAGDPAALFYMGQAYRLGRGVPENRTTALDYYRRAADKGSVAARTNLGITLYQDGRKTDALNELREAAAQGDARASYVLGVATFDGEGAKPDHVLGYAYVLRARDGGLTIASGEAARMALLLTAAEREKAVAVAALLQQSPMAGLAMADSAGAAIPSDGSPAPSPAASSAAAPAAAPVAGAGDGWRVQLGAYRSERAAQTAWATLVAQSSLSLKGMQPLYRRQGRLVRLQVGSWPERDAADRLCARLSAAGRPCFVTR